MRDLKPLMMAVDGASERYKLHLPEPFVCGLIFMELRAEHARKPETLSSVLDGIDLRGFIGGVVLRGEGHTLPHTGRLSITQSETPSDGIVREGATPLLEFGLSPTVRVTETVHLGVNLVWTEMDFARFAFDLIAFLHGTYDGRLSSFHGFGSTWDEMTQNRR